MPIFAGLAATVMKWFFGGGLSAIGKIGVDAYKAKLDSENTTESKVADLASRTIELDAKEAEINAKVVEVEQGNWFTRWVRPMWAAPFVLWTWKVVVWDAILKLGTTPDLKGTPGYLCLLIAGSYFGERMGSKIVDKIMSYRGALTGKKA